MAKNYSEKANAAEISGLAETDILDYQVTIADNFVEMLLNRSFGEATSHIDYYDINGDERSLQTTRWPIISITDFIDNQRETNHTHLVEDTDFFVDKEAGLIMLVEDEFNILKGSAYLTKGNKTVKVIYTWGFSETPEDIKVFADWVLAWIAEIKKTLNASKSTDGQVMRRIRAGNYEEAYDVGNTAVDHKYKGVLADMTGFMVRKYMRHGDSGTESYVTI